MFMINKKYLESLIIEQLKYNESEWLELKHNNDDKQLIGRSISALSNSAAINDKEKAYMIWGVADETKEIIGTTFNPENKKVGNEVFMNWLHRVISPSHNFKFHKVEIDNKNVVVLEVDRAKISPISYEGKKYVRVGSSTTTLSGKLELESTLWRKINVTTFENGVARFNLESSDVFKLIDYPSYFELLDIPLPDSRDTILTSLMDDDIISKNDAGTWNITNFGAVLFAKELSNFENLRSKSIRIINYKDNTRYATTKEKEIKSGYAVGFKNMIDYIMTVALNSEEIILGGIRKENVLYPELSIRELVANAVIHQDFDSRGNSPMIEIFTNRIEITNPGNPIIDVDKIINIPPKSRNEKIASMMRRIGICEKRGSGLDRVFMEVEKFCLNAPLIEELDDSIRITAFYRTDFNLMNTEDKLRVIYYHCRLKYANGEKLTNASLRERFNVDDNIIISRLIKKAVDQKLIKYLTYMLCGKQNKKISSSLN